MMRGLLFSLTVGFLGAVSASALPVEQEIAALYRRALEGEAAAVEQTIEKLEAIVHREPGNQLARVYLGSAYTLKSRDLGIGPKKLRALKQGLALMDEAVEKAPAQPKVRLVRALTTSALPGFIGRARQSRQDFQTLAQLADTQPDKFEKADLQIVYYRAAQAAKTGRDREGAASFYRKSLAYPVDSALVEKAKAELAAL